jgi:hypothetical protein
MGQIPLAFEVIEQLPDALQIQFRGAIFNQIRPSAHDKAVSPVLLINPNCQSVLDKTLR